MRWATRRSSLPRDEIFTETLQPTLWLKHLTSQDTLAAIEPIPLLSHLPPPPFFWSSHEITAAFCTRTGFLHNVLHSLYSFEFKTTENKKEKKRNAGHGK